MVVELLEADDLSVLGRDVRERLLSDDPRCLTTHWHRREQHESVAEVDQLRGLDLVLIAPDLGHRRQRICGSHRGRDSRLASPALTHSRPGRYSSSCDSRAGAHRDRVGCRPPTRASRHVPGPPDGTASGRERGEQPRKRDQRAGEPHEKPLVQRPPDPLADAHRLRTTCTFSCDIAYSDSPAASRACRGSRYDFR